jgi:hypothetical protein
MKTYTKAFRISTAAMAILPATIYAQEKTLAASQDADVFGFTRPPWLADLSLGVKEGFDNNLLGVSGYGLRPKGSMFTTVSPKVGFDFLPLLGEEKTFSALSFSYTPDYSIYYNAPQENYDAHKFNNAIKGKSGDFSFNLDNAFLFNDGSTTAPTYAVSQASAADENDKNRNFYAFAMPRERRKQFQDRASAILQYDVDKFFIRPAASFLYYDLETDLRNTAAGLGNVGYQDFPDRYDVNGGADLGYKIAPPIAVTLGYRYGHQYQEQFPVAVSPTDRHFSSSDYQRVLLGFEGKWNWLTYKMAGGPDFRSYNSMAPVYDFHPIKYYGEAVISAKINDRHFVTFTYKQWEWVSSVGLVPYFDSTFALNYHWNATKKLGLDLGGKILEADFTGGNENGQQVASQTASLRDDRQYSILAGASYAFTPRLNASVNYSYDLGANVLGNLPAALSATSQYRDFSHQYVAVGAQYKF